jgi:hypothetical protein
LLLLIWSALTIMLPVYNDIIILSRFWQLTYLLFYLIALRAIITTKILSNKIVRMLIVWSIYISFINLMNIDYSPFSYIETLLDTLWLPCIYIVFFDVFSKTSENNYIKFIKKHFILYFLVIISLVFYLITSFSGNADIYQIENQDLINSIYWILFLLPFCFYFDKKTKYLLFSIILVAIIISSKRSPLVSFGIILFFSLYRDFFKYNIKNIFFGIGAAYILYFIFLLAIENIEINSSQRLTSTTINEEPRYFFISESWESFKSKDLINIVFGSGHRSSAIDRGIGLSKTTHNDFFETLYSYGIIGFLMYLNLIIQICKPIKLISKKNVYDAYLATLVLFIVTSMFSHLLIHPTYFAFIIIIWAANGINTKLKFNNTK